MDGRRLLRGNGGSKKVSDQRARLFTYDGEVVGGNEILDDGGWRRIMAKELGLGLSEKGSGEGWVLVVSDGWLVGWLDEKNECVDTSCPMPKRSRAVTFFREFVLSLTRPIIGEPLYLLVLYRD